MNNESTKSTIKNNNKYITPSNPSSHDSKKISKKNFLNTVYRGLFLSAFFQLSLEFVASYVDMVIGGNILGDAAIAAIEVVEPLYNICYFLGALISVGCCNVYSRYIGAMQHEKAYKCIGQGLIVSIILGAFSAALMTIIMDPYIAMQGLSDTVAGYVRDYYYCFIILVFIYPLYYFISTLVFVDGAVTLVTISEFVRFLLNVVLSLVFLLVFDMGLFGLSLGTTLAMIALMAVLCSYFLKKSVKTKFMLGFNPKDIKDSIAIGASNSVTYLANAAVVFVLNQYIIDNYGDLSLVIYSAVMLVASFIFVLLSIANACMPIMGVYIGEKNLTGQKNVLSLSTKYALIIGVAYSILIGIFAPIVPTFLGVEDPGLFDGCTFAVRIMALCCWMWVYLIYVVQIHAISNHTVLAAIESLTMQIIGPMVFCILSIYLFGINFIGLGYLLSAVFAIIVFSLYIIIKYGVKALPFILETYDNKSYVLNTNTTQNIAEFNKEVAALLSKNYIKKNNSLKIQLILEEMFEFTKTHNNKVVCIEVCFVVTKDNLNLVYRDTGDIIDITDDSHEFATTKEVYMLDSIARSVSNFSYLTTVSYNKNTYNIKLD